MSFESELEGFEQDFQLVISEAAPYVNAQAALPKVANAIMREMTSGSAFNAVKVLHVIGAIREVTGEELVSSLRVMESDEDDKKYIGVEGDDDVVTAFEALVKGVVVGVTPELREWFSQAGRPPPETTTEVVIQPIFFGGVG